jgi:cytochrome c-type protein NapC
MFDRWRRAIRRLPLFFIAGGLIVGFVIGIPTTDAVDQYFSSNAFCANSCHVMNATVYKELQKSAHWNTKVGVRPKCADCHLSRGLTAKMWEHTVGIIELVAFLFRGIRTVEAFEKERPRLADNERFRLLANDSANCRSCHVMEAIKPERRRGQRQHAEARKNGTTCIVCHYNLVHKEIEPSDAFLKAAEGS